MRPQVPRLTGPTSFVIIGEELLLDCATDSGGVKTFSFYKDNSFESSTVDAPYKKLAEAGDAGDYYCFVHINGVRSPQHSNTVTVKGE